MRTGHIVVALASALAACEEATPKPRPTPPPAAPAPLESAVPTASASAEPPPLPLATPRPKLKLQGAHVVLDREGKWQQSCRIHRPCKIEAEPLPACAADQAAEPWSTFADKAEHLTDPRVSLRGKLEPPRATFSTGARCTPHGACCNHTRGDFTLDGAPHGLELVGYGCAGDESRLCCNALAEGQTVIATGDLSWDTRRWRLDTKSLCVVKE